MAATNSSAVRASEWALYRLSLQLVPPGCHVRRPDDNDEADDDLPRDGGHAKRRRVSLKVYYECGAPEQGQSLPKPLVP